ncbi:hypothetical protein T4A_14168 [Trichinella pseudospiralis]|uniref:Uncharacterized protein n=1 Tax=Trichinella pseudospiralis TaxID=6337 RepID=A0A0V1DN92_TRIPS|nr:hypothetical protein T4A_14168 [Trichinella pseudospiralis]
MAFYNGLSEKIKFSIVLLRLLLYLKIKASEARSMAFYRCLREKDKDKGYSFNGILQRFE